ncbi:MAG TPA: HEAT repeat domain-containing protein [Candidatus Xenobia bacterium]|nr:HEAT repeat domain-containing protein [Candidatus Xenobia bacterium]
MPTAQLYLLEMACWGLMGGILIMMALLVGRRWFRQRYFRRLDIWRQELEASWGRWLRADLPDVCWRTERHRRVLLAERAASVIEQPGGFCEASRHCTFLPAEVALACGDRGQPCAAPAYVRRRVEEWGLVRQQMEAVRAAEGLERAREIILLGRLRSPLCLPLLRELRDDPDPDVRLAAVRALGLLGTPEAVAPLLELLERAEMTVSIPSWQRALISCCQNHPALLLPALDRLSGTPRTLLMRVVAEVASPAILPNLLELAEDPDPQIRAHVARALGRLEGEEVRGCLQRLLHDRIWFVRVRAARALGVHGGWKAADLLLDALNDTGPDVRHAAGESLAAAPLPLDELFEKARHRLTPIGWGVLLGELGRRGLFWTLAEQLVSPAPAVRALAEQWLRAALENGARKTLLDALFHPEGPVADAMAELLVQHGDASLLPWLEELRARAAEEPGGLHRLQRLEQRLTVSASP